MSLLGALLKLSSENLFYHRTNNIDPVLTEGKLLSLRNISNYTPDKRVTVEPNRWNRDRVTLKAKNAYKRMSGVKDVDYIFLTKDAPIGDDSYGKYIIEKEISTPRKANNVNFIKDEYKQKRAISLNRTARVYAPSEDLEVLKEKYPGYKFADVAEIKKYHPSIHIPSFLEKVINSAFEKKAEEQVIEMGLIRKFSPNARLGGSSFLGTRTKDSDIDVFIPYKTKNAFLKAQERISTKFPELTASKFNKPDGNRFVFTSPKMDVALAYGEDAQKRVESEELAKARLTPQQIASIVKRKEELLNSWFFPQTRYKSYKRELDKKLGLHKF